MKQMRRFGQRARGGGGGGDEGEQQGKRGSKGGMGLGQSTRIEQVQVPVIKQMPGGSRPGDGKGDGDPKGGHRTRQRSASR
ncbi:MAG: hypothetical protein QM756_28765 [Polyangiaceae bacterium]